MTERTDSAGSSEYDALLADMEDILAKAQPVADEDDDDKGQGGGDDDKGDGNAANGGGDGDGDEGGEAIMKSFRVTLEDGTETEAYDGTAMFKAMQVQASRQRQTIEGMRADLAAAGKVLAKQGELLKSLAQIIGDQGKQLKVLREQPAGRKSAAATATPAAAPAMNGEEIMVKALAVQKRGDFSVTDVAEIEARLTNKLPLKAHHLAAIQAA